ncbi:hypothetical protein GGX14DRAFT_456576 [Mycena pura]|uniref:Uncharacterized protein n=1 Tax=Mycena pura TaxID=153505 RepID=A0AAD6VBA2_9AGAR|nr:hypothetical protein GGX14DRAFT_456576 [Mycena pura]
MILCLAMEVVIFRALRRAWATLKAEDRRSVSKIIRVLAFTLVGMLSIMYVIFLSLIFLALPNEHDTAFNIVIATIPVSSVLIFGTQEDILTVGASALRIRRSSHGADTWDAFTTNETNESI